MLQNTGRKTLSQKWLQANLPYISKDGHNLNKAHKYYSQVHIPNGNNRKEVV